MSQRGFVQTDCPSCGAVTLKASALACGVSEVDEGALCEFACPVCERTLLLPIAPIEVTSLLLLGARRTGRLPYELLEAHAGSAISWDEILDAHIELEDEPFPQLELAGKEAA